MDRYLVTALGFSYFTGFIISSMKTHSNALCVQKVRAVRLELKCPTNPINQNTEAHSPKKFISCATGYHGPKFPDFTVKESHSSQEITSK